MEKTTQTEVRQTSSNWQRLLSVSVGALGIFIFFRQFFLSGGRLIVGDMADGRLIMCIHEHWYRFLMGKEGFFEMGFFYPQKNVLGYSDTFLLGGLIHSVFRFIGLDVFLSFQLVQVVMCAMGFSGMLYWLNKYRKISYPVAVFGAFLFIIASPIFIETIRNNHFQMQTVWIVPWILVFLEQARIDIISNPTGLKKSFTTFALLYGLLIYSTFYVGWFFFLFSLLWLISSVVVLGPRFVLRAFTERIARCPYLMPGFCVLLCWAALFLWTYLSIRMGHGGRPFNLVLEMMPGLFDVVNHSQSNLLWGKVASLLHAYPPDNFYLFEPGPPLLFTLIVAVISFGLLSKYFLAPTRDDKIARITSLAVMLSFLLVFRFGEFSLWKIAYHLIPGGEGIRVVFRYVVLLVVPMIYLIAWGFSRLSLIPRNMGSIALMGVLGFFLTLEQIHIVPVALINRTEQLEALHNLPDPPSDAVAFFPVGAFHNETERAVIQFSSFLYSQYWNLPTIGGQSGLEPKGWFLNRPTLNDGPENLIRWCNSRDIHGSVYYFNIDENRWLHALQSPVVLDLSQHLGESLLTRELFSRIAGQGWSLIEPWGVWVDGKIARLTFPAIESVNSPLHLDFGFQAFLHSTKLPKQSFLIQMDGKNLHEGEANIENPSGSTVIEIPAACFRDGFTLDILCPDARSPNSIGESSDLRIIGIGLTKLVLHK